MEEDTIQPQQNQHAADPDSEVGAAAADSSTDTDAEKRSGQIFDITKDGISPIKDPDALAALVPQAALAKDTPATPPGTMPGPAASTMQEPHAPESPEPAAPPTPKPAVPEMSEPAEPTAPEPAMPQPGINQLQQPSRKMPLQYWSRPVQNARTTPANPPTKTLGAMSAPFLENTPRTAEAPKIGGAALNNPHIKSIRTYESDVAELMSRTHASATTIAIAESRRASSQTDPGRPKAEERIVNREPSHAAKNLFLVLISLMLVGGGSYGAYYLYTKSAIAPSAPAEQPATSQTAPTLVTADLTVVLPVDGQNAQAVIKAVQTEIAKPQPAGSIKEIVPVVLKAGNETRLTAGDMLKQMNIPVPNILARSLSDSWMLGIYENPGGRKTAFVVATNDFFQNAFAGMLQWEGSMPNDLAQYININAPSGQYTNKIVSSKDVREYVTADGQVAFLYSFIDSSTLVFAGDEAALTEIMSRLEKRAYVR